MKKQKIEDIFSSIENFSSVPPPELWTKIEEELNKPKKKKRAILWWSAAACLLLGLLLPTALHFNSDSSIETINNGSIEKSIAVDENKRNLDNNKAISNAENSPEEESDIVKSLSLEKIANQSNNSQNDKTHRTKITPFNSNNIVNSSISYPKSNKNEKTNQTVAEKTFITGRQHSFNSSDNKVLQSEKRNQNQTVAEKTFITGNQHSFNSSDNKVLQSEKRNQNQTVAEKTFITGNQHSFNSSDNKVLQSEKRNQNQTVAEKTFITGSQHSFNSSDNKVLQSEKRNQNQTVAEKTFITGSQHSFNSSDNKVPNSIFEDKLTSKNNVTIAINSSNLISDNKQNIKKEVSDKTEITTTIVAANDRKNNSISINTLSKQDSLQLVELQNLEKGLVEVKTEKDKENKAVPTAEKWSLEVFAGVANSENYSKQKTLGNVNESKQTNSYGIKTNYKLNKKWAVSSGLKINELGQSIANVSYFNNSEVASYPTISDYLMQSSTVVAPKITTNSSYVFVTKSTQNALKSDNMENGNIEQSLKYIEMPLEVSYAVFSKNKTSISLNTGGFVGKLISNNITLNGDSIGDNLNASDFVYGTLLSSTLQYRLYKKTHVFVEPGMNYYINPLNNQTFNQFQWAFNFGLNVSF